MADTFDAQLRRLEQEVGEGELIGQVTFDQVYARYQHEVLELQHPHGGGPKYLENTLKEKYERYYRALADSVLDGTLDKTMIEVAEDLAGESARRAPIEKGTLRASASPEVTSNGIAVYHRPGAPRIED